MASTLEILRAERAAQDAEEARPPFVNVNDARVFIATESPAASDNITLEMCWLGAKEFERGWHAELLNRADEEVFEEVENQLKSIDPARRSKCVFALTIWKSRDETLNVLSFRKGFSYRFEKVHSLKLVYGNPAGSMQIRGRVAAVHLPLHGFRADTSVANEHTSEEAAAPGVLPSVPSATTTAHLANGMGLPSKQPVLIVPGSKTSPRTSTNPVPLARTPCKRKGRKIEGNTIDDGGGLDLVCLAQTKKTRSCSTKELSTTEADNNLSRPAI